MALTEAQLTTLKAAIEGDSTLNGYWLAGNIGALERYWNEAASPAYIVWRSSVTAENWRAAIIGGGGATQLDGLTASKRESLLWACSDMLRPSDPAVRAALDDFCGSQATLKAALQAAQKRSATNVEKLFASGTGSDASPATMGFEGFLPDRDIEAAMRS
jgi:hypothetical protein